MYSSSTYFPTQNTSSSICIVWMFLFFFSFLVSPVKCWGSTWKSTTSLPSVSLVIHHSLSSCRIWFYIISYTTYIFLNKSNTCRWYIVFNLRNRITQSAVGYSVNNKVSVFKHILPFASFVYSPSLWIRQLFACLVVISVVAGEPRDYFGIA